MIGSAQDLKVSVVAPIRVPGVGNQPVRRPILNSPAQDTNGMSSQHLATHMLIHSRLVVDQILIDSKGALHRSICHDLVLNLRHVLVHRVRGLAKLLVVIVVDLVAVLALLVTLGRLSLRRIAGRTIPISVMFAGSNLVRPATLTRPVGTATDQSLAVPVGPGGPRETSVASKAAGVAAGDQIVGRESEVLRLIGVNAVAVRHCLHCSKGPARATRALVTNLSDGRAVWPLLARVKVLRQVGGVDEGCLQFEWKAETTRVPVYAHQTSQVLYGSVWVEVLTGLEERAKERGVAD